MPHSTASDLGLHCLYLSHKRDARLKWVNNKLFSVTTGHQIKVHIGKLFSLFLITYVVGAQKNHLNETVLLSTQTHV